MQVLWPKERMNMKKLVILLTVLTVILTASALADPASDLMSQPGARIWMLNESDMAIRTVQMPFVGASDQEDWEVCLYIDFCKLGAPDVTAMRVDVSTVGPYELLANEVCITVGKKTWTFSPSRTVSEYDLVYYEDFYACLDNDALDLITALAKGKGTCNVILRGTTEVSATITIPAEDAAALLSLYKTAGGADQDLTGVTELWPVTVTK